MNLTEEALVYELSSPGRVGVVMPDCELPDVPVPEWLERGALSLPELDELTVVRHFTRLSQKNFSIDTHFYPLGSCTMKYNPKVNEAAAALPGFRLSHPLMDEGHCQGALELLFRLQGMLGEIGGFEGVSVQPAAGAHAELAGVLMIRACHLAKGCPERTIMLVPDSAHGTNPASCTMAGLETRTIPSLPSGDVDCTALEAWCTGPDRHRIAGLMLTNPNTLGLFERELEKVCKLVHAAGGYIYGDGANMNALTGIFKPGKAGIDVMHFNLHKTFSTPHGGGGPGAGMIAANAPLSDFLPGPLAERDGGRFFFRQPAQSIGRVKSFHGNFAVLVRAYAYIRMLGAEGMRRLAENAVLNANYLRVKLAKDWPLAVQRTCMHELVLRGTGVEGVHTLDVAKRLIDYGIHPPTIYFPLNVSESIMIEPTETETLETLNRFVEVMGIILREARETPELLHSAPHNTPVGRLDEVSAARNPMLCYRS